jgi:branched-subunit amino acid aminotransferase/4-amino-4-deoxychorismate lyase
MNLAWTPDGILPADRIRVGIDDRTFEHGLGLFETFRSRGGRSPLLGRHLARLGRSAAALGLRIEATSLPGPDDVARLSAAVGLPDALFRLTATGGAASGGPSTVWMTCRSLPPAPPAEGIVVGPVPWSIDRNDPLARHKSLNYWLRRLAFESAAPRGFGEVILRTADGRDQEGSRTNLFLVREGELITPAAEGPIVPGILRAVAIERARHLGIPAREVDGLSPEDWAGADDAFLTNSVRGIIPIRSYERIAGDWPRDPGIRRALGAALADQGSWES